MTKNKQLTFEEFLSEFGDKVEDKWQKIEDEYGDAAPLLSMYKTQLWREYNNNEIDSNLNY